MLIFFICFLFLYSEMKMIPTKTIFNVTEDQEIVRVQWTKKTVTFCHCWYVCTSAYIVIFTPSRKRSVCDKKKPYYSSLFIFVSKGIHLLYLLPSKCLTFFTIWQFNAFWFIFGYQYLILWIYLLGIIVFIMIKICIAIKEWLTVVSLQPTGSINFLHHQHLSKYCKQYISPVRYLTKKHFWTS